MNEGSRSRDTKAYDGVARVKAESSRQCFIGRLSIRADQPEEDNDGRDHLTLFTMVRTLKPTRRRHGMDICGTPTANGSGLNTRHLLAIYTEPRELAGLWFLLGSPLDGVAKLIIAETEYEKVWRLCASPVLDAITPLSSFTAASRLLSVAHACEIDSHSRNGRAASAGQARPRP